MYINGKGVMIINIRRFGTRKDKKNKKRHASKKKEQEKDDDDVSNLT
jgi:hypothetical protein